MQGFPPGAYPIQPAAPTAGNDGREPPNRSVTPENHSSRSPTPEENRTNPNVAIGENDKSSKEDRYKERYRDDREHHLSSHRSSSHRSHHRSNEHEYERPRGDRKSSRDRDDKYERSSRK